MKRNMLAAILLTASNSAISAEGDLWLNIHIASKHSGDYYFDQRVDWEGMGEPNNEIAKRPYNEQNYGLGFIYEVEDFLDSRAGFFKNSVHETSIYGGGSLHTSNTNLVSVGVMLGIVSGYEAAGGQTLMPIALPYIGINSKHVRAELTYLPAISDKMNSVVSFSMSVTY